MKRLFIIAITTIAAASASASVARMSALNQSTENGSKYILDSRNVFANPAHYHNLSSFVQLEFGDAGSYQNTAGNTTTATGNPTAQGGFFQKTGNTGYGVWLGNDSKTAYTMKSLTNNANLPNPDNSTEFAYIGQASSGMKWGASAVLTSNKDSDANLDRNESSLGARFGAQKGKWDAGITLALSNKMEAKTAAGATTTDTLTGKLGFAIHAGYKLRDNYTGIFEYESASGDYETGGTSTSIKLNSMKLGIAKKIAVDSGFFFWEAGYSQQVSDTGTKVTDTTLPLTLGLESKANDWLTLRGSARQNFFLNTRETAPATGTSTKTFNPDSIRVAGGATLHFDKFEIDGVVAGTNTNGVGTLNSQNLMGNVSMNYMF